MLFRVVCLCMRVCVYVFAHVFAHAFVQEFVDLFVHALCKCVHASSFFLVLPTAIYAWVVRVLVCG